MRKRSILQLLETVLQTNKQHEHQLLEELPGWQWDAGEDPWLETYQRVKSWRARHGNDDRRSEVWIGGHQRKKCELKKLLKRRS